MSSGWLPRASTIRRSRADCSSRPARSTPTSPAYTERSAQPLESSWPPKQLAISRTDELRVSADGCALASWDRWSMTELRWGDPAFAEDPYSMITADGPPSYDNAYEGWSVTAYADV